MKYVAENWKAIYQTFLKSTKCYSCTNDILKIGLLLFFYEIFIDIRKINWHAILNSNYILYFISQKLFKIFHSYICPNWYVYVCVISVQIFILSRKQTLDYTKSKTKSTYFGHVKTIKRFLCSRESYCCKKILTKICVPNIFMFYAKALE